MRPPKPALPSSLLRSFLNLNLVPNEQHICTTTTSDEDIVRHEHDQKGRRVDRAHEPTSVGVYVYAEVHPVPFANAM